MKTTLILAIIVFLCTLYFNFFNDSATISIVIEDQDYPAKEKALPPLDLTIIESDAIKQIYLDNDSYKKQQQLGICSTNYEKFLKAQHAVLTVKQAGIFTEKQAAASQKFLDSCNSWHDLISEISNDELNKIIRDKYDTMQIVKHFIYHDKLNPETLKDAKFLINTSNGDATAYTYMALDYLMNINNDLIEEIAKNLETKDLEYIKSNNDNIIQLFVCATNPQSCSSDTEYNLLMCITDVSYCGKSTSEYIASTVSPNHYADLNNMVHIIIKLMQEGFFDTEISI